MKKLNITKKFLYREYIINGKSSTQIAVEIGCSAPTIIKHLKINNIQTRTISEAKNPIILEILTVDFLYQEYVINKKSTVQIAKEIGCSGNTVRRKLIKYNIKIRTQSEARKLLEMTGKKASGYKDGRTLKIYYCIEEGCNNIINYDNWLKGNKRCQHCAKQGILSTFWQGGKSFEPYPISWTKILKESIRVRDNHQCHICGISEKNYYRKLDVHHIDYDKQNLNSENLITLCQSCHTQTNANREIYIEFFGILNTILREKLK